MEEFEDVGEPADVNINILPKAIYGLRLHVLGNINFGLNQDVIYPVENVLAFHDFVNKTQKFLRFPEGVTLLGIAVSPSRKLLAVLEQFEDTKQVSVYDLANLTLRRTLKFEHHTKDVEQMTFTPDSKGIVLLTSEPEAWLILIVMDTQATTFECRPLQTFKAAAGNITCLACNPQDSSIIAVAGENMLLFMAKNEKSFNISHNFKVNFTVISMAFTNGDFLWLGTDDNQVVLVEGTEIKLIQAADTAEFFDMLWDQETLEKELTNRLWVQENDLPMVGNVCCMTTYSRGFLYTIYNYVYVFENTTKFRYDRKFILYVPINYYDASLFAIRHLVIDHKQETIIVITEHAQIYKASLVPPENTRSKTFEFSPLGSLIHIDAIVHVSVCAWKPIIMTASRDQTIRIWNYETETIELVRKFQVDINIAELNAMGLFAAIGFTDQLRVAEIFMDELNIVKTYNFPRCKDIKYSDLGHLMGVAYDNMIVITSLYNLAILKYLKGHNGIVLTLCWTKDDQYLLSGGADGAIYQWDVETGTRLQEIVQKGTEYRCLCCTLSEPLSIYAATNHGVMREFQNSELVREVLIPSREKSGLKAMCLARSDLIMFISNELDELFNVKLPFMEAGGGGVNSYRFFASRVNSVVFSYDGTLLISVSNAGTLAIWTLQNIEGKIAPMDIDLLRSQEVLIPRSLLKEKIEQIATLELRLKQQAEEFHYQLSQNEIFDGQQLAQVHQRYIAALEDLKAKSSEMEARHAGEMNKITFQINDLNKENRKQIETLSNQFSERLLVEYQKYSTLRESMLQLRESYENRLKTSAGTLQDTVEGLESNYKQQLDERKELIRELLKEMGDKKVEFIEFCRQVEEENKRNIEALQTKYENKLNLERNKTKMWRGRAGVLQKKYETLNRDIELMVEEVVILKDEHVKSQRNIAKLNRDIDNLQRDISDRDFVINFKENRIQELLRKNLELDKNKQVLNHKIADLKAQIEPIEFQINDKRKHIMELEKQLDALNDDNINLESQLKELKERYIHNVGDLRLERYRSKTARKCIYNLCSEIYQVAGNLQKPKYMKEAVKQMFENYANDNELKRYVQIEEQVREEFERQRRNVENWLQESKNKPEDNVFKQKYQKVLQENITLLNEIDALRKSNKELEQKIARFVSLDLAKNKKKLPTNKK